MPRPLLLLDFARAGFARVDCLHLTTALRLGAVLRAHQCTSISGSHLD
jgi:hypothetical protein